MAQEILRGIQRTLHFLRRSRFVRDTLTLQIGTFIFMAATFASSIVFARVLGTDQFGLYAVVLAFVGFVTTFTNVGQGAALMVFFTEQHAKRDRHGQSVVLRNFLQLSIITCTLHLFMAAIAPSITLWLYGNAEIGKLARIVLVFQSIDLWNSMAIILLQAVRKIRAKMLYEQVQNVSYVGLAIGSVLLGFGIRGILVSQLLVSIVMIPIGIKTLYGLWRDGFLPGIREIAGVRLKETKTYMMQGLLIALDKNIGNFFPQGLFFFTSLVAPAALVGILRISVHLAQLTRSFLLPQAGDLSINVFATLRATSLTALRKSAALLIKHALAVHAAISVVALTVLPLVIRYAYSREYLEAIPLTLWLVLLSLPTSICIVNAPILRLWKKIHFSTAQAIISWAVMIVAILLGAKIWSPPTAFLIAYAIGQAGPLLLTLYIFQVLLRKAGRPTSLPPAT